MCVYMTGEERKRRMIGQKLPNQEEEEDSSGRAPGEKRTNGEKREGELTSQRGGKEERREEKTRGIGRIPNSTRATRTHFRRNFSMFPVSLLQTNTWKTFYDLPSTHSIPNLERFGVEIRKNAQKGAVALCVRFSHF